MSDTEGHSLPSARHLADFSAFFFSGTFQRDGMIKLVLNLPPEEASALVKLRDNDGLALNVSVWETELPEGSDELAKALGIDLGSED